jgi:hypothetical protein
VADTALIELPALVVADGGLLVREIEAYLRSLPTPPRGLQVPPVCAFGQTVMAWDTDLPARPGRTLADRLHRRPAPPVPLTVAGHLRLVSRYLATYGWCQNAMWDAQGRRCLLGAQVAVLAAGYGTPDTVMRARTALMEQFIGQDPEIRTVDQWNDADGRTAAQVHRQLDIAASRTYGRG